MKYKSVFDIIGPVMIGPSSSHTAGAVRIGKIVNNIFGKPIIGANIHFYGSFAQTYKGHGTDVAIVGGLLGFDMDDDRIPNAIKIAKENNIEINFFIEDKPVEYQNTARVEVWDNIDKTEVTGVSVGGGIAKITRLDDFEVDLSGDKPTILVIHDDVYGTISEVSRVLAERLINISSMQCRRLAKGDRALMQIEIDNELQDHVEDEISKLENVVHVQYIRCSD